MADRFRLVSDFKLWGDQPQAVDKLVIAHNKTLAAQLYSDFKLFFHNSFKRGQVE